MAFQALAKRWDRGVGEAMGDQPDDLYTNSTGGAEPVGWTDPAPLAPAPFDTPSSYAAEHSPAYGSAGFEPPHQAPTPAGDGGYESAYGVGDSHSQWSEVNEPERGAAPTAVLDDPWTRSSLAPVSPVYDAPTAPHLAITPLGERQRSVLAEPIPRSWMLMVAGGVALALIVAFLVQALIVRGDWAESALVAGYTAFGLAVFALVIAGIRYALGRRATVFYTLAGLLLVVLLGTGGGALAMAHQLHLLQAQSFEASGQWSQAATEYALYGERAPHAPNLGRVYLHWGQDLAQKQAWSDAAIHLSAALVANPSDADLAAQANTALYATFVGWMKADAAHVPYAVAIDAFAAQREASSCDAACQDQSATFEAQARYLYGQQLSTAQSYAEAASQFSTIETQFASSAYASQAHAAAATAYLALGQQQIASKTCTDAVPTYQTLTKTYSDTSEGKQAAAALAAPQKVTGKFTGLPTGNPVPRVRLSKFANPTAFVFSNDYATALDATTGAFTFAAVKPGAYNLSTARDLGYKVDFHYYHGATGDLYSIKVGPLCAVDLGSIAY
jgi:tetratricopeptide (TPR) repeat protein